MRVAEAVDAAAARDLGLELRVLAHQLGVVAEGVPEGEVPGHVAAERLDVEVDPELVAAELDGTDEHRAGRRPGIGPRLRPEAEGVERLDDAGDLARLDLDREVHDPLAGQARDRGAPDVLDDEVRSPAADHRRDRRGDLGRPRVPFPDVGLAPLVRQDREFGAVAPGIGHGVEV